MISLRLPSVFVLVGVVALLLHGCKGQTTDEIRIGAYLPLSGSDAAFGTDAHDGIDLAITEINAAGGVKGKKLSVIFEDDKSTPVEATQKVRKLIDRDNVVALIGEATSSKSLVGGLIANTSQVPMVTPTATAVEVTQGREWVFRTCYTDDLQGLAAGKFAHETLKKKKAAIFYAAQDTYSSGLAKSFREELGRHGGEIVYDKGYQKGETNFRTYLAELKGTNPEVIYTPVYYSDMVPIARQAKEAGLTGNLFLGSDGWDASVLLNGAAAELEGAYFTNHYAPDMPEAASKKFLEAFRAKYKRDPGSFHALGYDTARLLADAIGRAPAPTRAGIRQALAETKDFVGATGKMTMDANRNAKKPILMVRIQGGKFTYASEVNLTAAPASPP
jgi:branched-chain amino acid transport system substrate-binding protein